MEAAANIESATPRPGEKAPFLAVTWSRAGIIAVWLAAFGAFFVSVAVLRNDVSHQTQKIQKLEARVDGLADKLGEVQKGLVRFETLQQEQGKGIARIESLLNKRGP